MQSCFSLSGLQGSCRPPGSRSAKCPEKGQRACRSTVCLLSSRTCEFSCIRLAPAHALGWVYFNLQLASFVSCSSDLLQFSFDFFFKQHLCFDLIYIHNCCCALSRQPFLLLSQTECPWFFAVTQDWTELGWWEQCSHLVLDFQHPFLPRFTALSLFPSSLLLSSQYT